MKIIFALCFAALCITTYGQTAKRSFSKDTWGDYIAISKKIEQLETKVRTLSLDTLEKKGFVRLQGQAQKISGDEANQAELAAEKNFVSKTAPLQKEIARLKSKQQELAGLYAMPPPLPVMPKPAKKAKS